MKMFKLVYLCAFSVAVCQASGYGGSSGGGGGGSYGGGAVSAGAAGVGPVSGFGGGPVTAAVQSTHTVEIRHVNVPQEMPQPQIVEVEAGNLPLTIHFKSASSALNVVQTHQPGVAGEPQHTSSEDEPHKLVHEVTKPVIQEVREIITPYRRVIQEIKPVQEEIQTIIAKGESRGNLGGDAGAGFGAGLNLGAGVGGGGGSLGGYGGASLRGGASLKSSGAYAASASNQASVTSNRATASSKTQSSPTGVSYFSDNLAGVSFASSGSAAPVAPSSNKASYASGGQIRIIEGGNSRSSGLSGISAYKAQA